MAESVISIVGEIAAEHVVDSIATRVGYIRNYKANFENLEKKVKNLQGRRDAVQHKIDEATKNGDEIEELVQKWLDSVINAIKEATDIIEDNKRLNMRCFKSLCPDLKKRYQQSKIARMKTDDISKLHNEGTFDRVSYRTLPAETWHPDSYENIKSRHSTMEGVLNALHNPDVNMIGVYGMGGSGKTTLVREVARKAEEDKLFDQVVFAEVSDMVDIRKIQGVIAERLGLKFHEDTEPVRADRLRKRIMQETKILLILDDIWKDLDLVAVGIPFGNNHVGCKLLLTSRDMDLLNEMGSESNFFVDVLEEEEACNLFMKIAGVGEEQHGLRSLAFKVAKECGGLLVAIITVAKALKNKQQCEWDIALRELSNPPSFENVEGSVVKKAYMSIHLSYKHLESEELKSTFLLCSIMACTHDASIEELLRYAVGLRLFKAENTMEDERDKAKKLVRQLKDSSLLLGTRNSETFSIHDVMKWAVENTLQNCTSITLHDILELPKPLECPKLQFFYMKTKTRLTKIPDNFFKGMPHLSVLHLIEMYLSPLPTSLCLLKKLQTLNLDGCHLEDIAKMKDMENLEILVIGFDSDKQLLPEEIGQLTSLRLLDLRNCSFIIPPKTLSRLTQLEELYMGHWYDQREVEESVASLEELKDLSHLTALHIRVADAEILPKGLDFFQKLKRYKIVIGERWYSREALRTLHVSTDTNILSEDGVIKQLKGIEDLHLGGKQRVKNVLYELDGEGFPQLKHFHIRNNPYIQLIEDSITSATCEAFPLLETLYLYNLVRLEKICHDQLRAKCFCQLTTIFVLGCGKLKNLFSFSIAKHLSQLKRIVVDDCGNMEEIFSIGRTDDVNNNEVVCDQLHSLTLESLPRLRRICSESGIASTSQERQMPLTTDASEDQVDALPLFGEKVVFPNLKRLELSGINLKKIWPNQLPLFSRCFQSLTTLIVRSCDNLKYLFSSSTLGSLKQLQHLEIKYCKELEELIRIDDNCSNYVEFPSLEKLHIQSCPEIREFIFSDKVSFPSLQEIQIHRMKNLKMIWQNQLIESVQYCPKLCIMELENCKSLENLFPASITRSLLELEKLHVSSCGIKEIVSKEERVDQEEAARFVFPRLSSLKLYSLEERGCFYPGKHTTEWPKLRKLKVEYGEKIDLFNFQKNNEGQPDVPVQQHLFMVDKAFSNLEKVTICRNHIRIICQSSYPEDLFPNLEFLEVTDDKSTVFPPDILVRFHNLKKLKLTSSSYKEIFSFEEVEKHTRTLVQIKSLCIRHLDNLKQLWKQDSKMDLILQKLEFLQVNWCDSLIILMPPAASLENLKILKVFGCHRLLSLVVASTAKSLVHLEEMSITYCQEMTEIIANEGDVLEGEIIFRRLKSLELKSLSNLTCFCYGNYTLNFPLLEKLKMEECTKMQFFSSGVVRTPKLQEASQVSQNWTKYVWECDNLNTFIKQHREKEVFSNAKQLNLNGNDIRMIWQSRFPEHIFPKVKCLHFYEDKSTVFPFGIFQIFHNVAKLDLTSSSYKEIFPHEEVQKHEGELPQIKRLHVTELHDLEQMWKPDSKLDLILLNLEILEVKRCKSLINVLLPSSSFENLKILKVEGCERLISLVAASTAKCMVQLEEMQICRCIMMTEVVAKEGDITEEEDKIIFHKLKKLELNDLSSLTSFSSGNYTFNIPVLEKLNVEECPNMMIFSSRDLNTPMLREVLQDLTEYTCENDLNKIVQQHHEEMVFSREKLNFESIRIILQKFVEHHKVFSNLEQLSFSRDEIRMLWQSQFPQHLFPKLELLEVSRDESTVFQLAILERFQNVEKLELNYGSYEEILSCEEVEKHVGTLEQIKSLSLYRLDDLKQMWKQDSKMDLNLQNLETLQVEWCGSLVTLMPPSASFQNLTRMSVEGCHRLMCFLVPSTAKSLVRLKYMTIKRCNMMIEVISSNEGSETRDGITFEKLWSLDLDGLSSLTSFCSGKYTFNFPCLHTLTMKNCPKIKIFSSGVLNTPELQKIQHDSKYFILDGDLNATIHGIHEKLNTKNSTEDCAGPSALSPSSSAI
ncbi:hypothetical protein EZV62_027500 [Acer yangbiense]|uniref:AAA+ ATPase domain-containing protein n=1 Tax=Acer yangbiense TaxID=1000413 RepID=A0A5C7GVR0_9ROSI|nr:hypothetical protein EZV62_027500 [Acer yangbiense]